ncbi:hypothetical protein G0U57_018489 [Chelydra serpentina]|uniref:Uncharacterized protein n=1 Tax=Chelydra serpentina TaxID=8475 RepID=A0A8T1SZ53_CHESE|nr:hypothetical protein G0U57_018489 [Chelydra serpentina]
MFSELMKSYSNERAQQNAWRQTMAESRKALNEHDERRQERNEMRQDAILKLMGKQTDMLRCLLQLQERQQEHRPSLQLLFTAYPPPQVPYPPHPDTQERVGGDSGHPAIPPQRIAQSTEGWHSKSF